jgi:tetratricopeptide (TPR) repeat protein
MVCFSSANKNLLAYSNEGYDISRDDKEIFMKFFRYVFKGHPQILAKLARDNTIPKKIWVYYYSDLEKIDVLTISDPQITPKHSFSLAEYTSGVLAKDEDGFLHFLHKIRHSEDIDLIKYMDSLLKEADTYFQAGSYLDAMLTFIEYRFVSGLPFPTEADDNVLRLFKAIRPPEDNDAAKEHLKTLTDLEKEAKFKKHIVMLFKANTYLKMGTHQDAKKLFHKALKANPHIALAYKDLGGIYFKESNTKIAWRCWDVARKIAPGHRMLMYLDGYEKKFELTYPEFF